MNLRVSPFVDQNEYKMGLSFTRFIHTIISNEALILEQVIYKRFNYPSLLQ
jgi:hypothetical protein